MNDLADPTEEETGPDEAAYTLDRKAMTAILYAVDVGDRDQLVALLEPLHAADIADMLEQMNAYDRRRLVELYDKEFDGEILSELNEGVRDEIIQYLNPEVLKEAVRELDSDDVVDLVEYLEEPQQEAILEALEIADRVAVEQALTYPEESAGRLMQREVVAVPEFWTVGQTIDMMREREDLPEQFYHVILVDPKMRPVAHVTLGKLMASPRKTALSEITEPGFRTIPALQDEGDVAYAFNQYHIISAPVVDEDDRLVGVITIDDAMIVLDLEHEEDILRLAGVGEGSLNDRFTETVKQRLPWLAVNLCTAILSASVISLFEDAIAKVVALAVLMPIVASMGGNAGTQGLTVAVRAIATKDLTGANVWRVIRREAAVGVVNGLSFALIMGIIAFVWFGSPVLGAVIGAAMIVNLFVAAIAGTVVPVVLNWLKVDPALASGTFVTTVTDVVGFFSFLGFAVLVLL
ncbi:magnesium transporter [Pseudooceanicola sp. CBS1P-1]|uniref:Magnesium transporter MgtE n=1 Tax=Pseudooceanicola albus TaxID=2692189 RepID=A0A6L7G4D8_9RHOB|nr:MULTISPECIES: magnesium transporter [Pseudooceanicola]MBT9384687.1 magnesium transporter [Pseudooceanicola endophyticus]MXN18388.1 magnesium transporter [Pseudooceanicola albus]